MWDKCKTQLKKILSIQEFTMYIAPLKVQLSGNKLNIISPNAVINNYINKHLKDTISSTIKTFNSEVSIQFEVIADSGRKKLITNNLTKEFSFDNLVEGNANAFALSAGKQIANNIKNATYNPFVIYGESGLGKTHLMQAIGILSLQLNPGLRVVYISLNDFVRNITSGIRHKNIEEVKEYYKGAQLLLIDDIHMITGKEKTQEEFFHIFNFLFGNKKQIIMTCDQVPHTMVDIETRLKTRLTSGFSVEVKPPEQEMREAILSDKATKQQIKLTEEAIEFIASNIKSNVRDLEGALITIKGFVEFSGLKNAVVDRSVASSALGHIISQKRINVDILDIQKETAKQYGITTSDLTSKSRKQHIMHARHTAIFLSKELTNHSLSSIGEYFGKRDHSTVINSCKKFEELIGDKPDIHKQYEVILTRLSTI